MIFSNFCHPVPAPCLPRRGCPTAAAGLNARLARSYAVCPWFLPSRHAQLHSRDADCALRVDTVVRTPINRYSHHSELEPTRAPPWLRVSRVARVDPHGVGFHTPNELAANWAPAMADTALESAETKPSTEKLLPPSGGSVANTSRQLAHSEHRLPSKAWSMPRVEASRGAGLGYQSSAS